MASRTSHLVNPEKGVLLYENTGTKAELISVHAVSHDGTKNPALSFAIDTNNSRPLNFEKSLYSLTFAFVDGTRLVDLDTQNSGKAPVFDRANSTSLMGDNNGAFSQGSEWANRFLSVDPWMTVKPEEYGNASGTCSLLTWGTDNSNQWYYYDNILDDRAGASDPNGYYYFFDPDNNVANHTSTSGISYYNRGWAADQYTNMFMGWNSNAYMTFGGVWDGTGYGDGNRSSDSTIYQRYGTSFNSASYESTSNTHSPLIYADGGVFVINLRRYNSTSNSYVHVFPIRYYFGDLPADKSTISINNSQLYIDGGGHNYSNVISSSANWHSYFSSPAGAYQWHKYNKANDKYYFCFKHSTLSYAGIYEWEWVDMTGGNSISYGAMTNLTGNGPGGTNFWSHSQGSWSRVADYPLSSSTANMGIPYKVGENLWISQSDNGSYYSTDLKTWQTASSFFSGINSLYVVANHGASGEKFYGKVNTPNIVRPTSGFSDVPTAGLLEKNTPVGNYSRTGIVLNPGDCIYSENGDLATALSITVNAVDI